MIHYLLSLSKASKCAMEAIISYQAKGVNAIKTENDDKHELGKLNVSEKKRKSNTHPKEKRVSQSKQIHWQAYGAFKTKKQHIEKGKE